MTTIFVIAAMIVVVGIVAVFWEMRRHRRLLEQQSDGENQQVLMEWLKDMREAQQQHSTAVQNQMQQTNRAINQRLDKAASVMQSVGTEVGKMQEVGQTMKEIHSVLKSPKLRGNLGEQVMKDLLTQILPKAGFTLQHKFRSGDTVDAVIKTKNGLIPIDAKFPMENYLAAQKAPESDKPALLKQFRRDVKLHIDKISKKYIVPGEQTVDFAVMYVPSESVYYEIVTATELANYGADKKVYLVSPNTFHYFLKTVMVALEGEQIEKRAKDVLMALRAIQQDATTFGSDLSVLSRHVTNAKNMMDTVNTDYASLGAKISNTGQLGGQRERVKHQLSEMTERTTEETADEHAPELSDIKK